MKPMNKESGNVLFLILIAVALFAALSYAVTQSTRSGSGSTDREQSLLGSATLTQYPTALRTAVVRMVLGGTDIRDVYFNTPGNFTGVSTNLLVFHPDGGGAVYQEAPADVMATGGVGRWYHSGEMYIPQIGRDTGNNANELIAFLPGINSATCERINTQMGIEGSTGDCTNYEGEVPESTFDIALVTENIEDDDPLPNGPGTVLECAGGTAFVGKPTGCFYHTATTQYVFYSVIMER